MRRFFNAAAWNVGTTGLAMMALFILLAGCQSNKPGDQAQTQTPPPATTTPPPDQAMNQGGSPPASTPGEPTSTIPAETAPPPKAAT